MYSIALTVLVIHVLLKHYIRVLVVPWLLIEHLGYM
jgi:hypothetical protein